MLSEDADGFVYDEFGFAYPADELQGQILSLSEEMTRRAPDQLHLFEKFSEVHGRSIPSAEFIAKVDKEGYLKASCRAGLPMEARIPLWMQLSSAASVIALAVRTYTMYRDEVKDLRELDAAGEKIDVSTHTAFKCIELDVDRTFPGAKFVEAGSEFSDSLRDILCCFALAEPRIGYCQGINFIAGFLLHMVTVHEHCTYRQAEERSFWLLKVLVGKILGVETFSPTLENLHTELRMIDALAQTRVSFFKSMSRSDQMKHSAVFYATSWMLTAYINVLPAYVVLRILDACFYEGNKVLFRIAVALIESCESELERAEGIYERLKLLRDPGLFVYSADTLMKRAFEIPRFSRKKLEKLHDKAVEMENHGDSK